MGFVLSKVSRLEKVARFFLFLTHKKPQLPPRLISFFAHITAMRTTSGQPA